MANKRTKNIALRVHEISDSYALETLYHELKKAFPEDNLYFSCNTDKTARAIVSKYSLLEKGNIQPDYKLYFSRPGLVIQVMSDTTEDLARYESGPFKTLCVDVSLLKAMRVLPSPSELKRIKKQYGLEAIDESLATMGWLSMHQTLGMDNEAKKIVESEKVESARLIRSIAKTAHLIVTPPRCPYPSLKYYKLGRQTLSNITEVAGFGNLAKLYAVADVAFSGHNLRIHGGRLNNFFEQSQGGPVFMVPPKNTKQYGYREFVEEGMIKPCKNVEEIIKEGTEFLQELESKPELKARHRQKCLAHRRKTRKQFLPEIFERIRYLLESGEEKQVYTYIHPESNWEGRYFAKNPIETFGEDYKNKVRGLR